MDDLRNKIIAAILGAVFGGLTTGGITALSDKSDKIVERNELLTSENAMLKSSVSKKESQISLLQTELNTSESNYSILVNNFQELSENYKDLNDKYKKCISSGGLIENVGSIDLNKHSKQFRTGDNLKFELTSKPLVINFVRVTDRGPVIEICDCLNYLTVNSTAISSSSNNQYLLQKGKTVKIRFSVNSCESDIAIEPKELEEIQLKALDFNTEEQIFHIEYHRDFLIK